MKKAVKIKKHRLWWHVPLNFFIHSLVGGLIAIGIGAPAVALGFVVEKLEEWHVAHFTISVLSSVEKAILLVDAIAVICYVIVASWRELKDILRSEDGDDDGEERS